MTEKDLANRQSIVRLICPAKLNLGLRIVGRRTDGLHLLESLFWPIDLTDEILLLKGEGADACTWAEDAPRRDPLPSPANNLARRALDSLKRKETYSIHLKKRIPIGAGLGGGSSDAGAILRYFRDSPLMNEAAKSLGADVAYFLNPKPAWVSGFGEQIFPFEVDPGLLESLQFLLVMPDFSLSTGDVFRAYQKSEASYSEFKNPFSNTRPSPEEILNYFQIAQNDLLKAAISIQPELKSILVEINKLNPDFSCMTGSGSTCVAVWVRRKAPSIKDLTRPFRTLRCRVSIVKSHADTIEARRK